MAITLGGLALPDGLRWSDEFTWTPPLESSIHTLTGALVLQIGVRQAGRPITLVGGERWAWMTRAHLLTLQALLDDPVATRTLTLHDGRSFSVVPVREGNGPLDATPKTVVGDSGPANPSAGTWYVINAIRLREV